MFVRGKLNSIEKTISEALNHAQISHKEFKEEENCRLKDSIRAKGNQCGHITRDRLIKHGKRIRADCQSQSLNL